MTVDLLRHAHAVLFPATDETQLDDGLLAFLAAGGRSLLLGESRAEYVARRMSEERVASETAGEIRQFTSRVAGAAGRPVLIGMDVEFGGIERSRHLAGELPTREEVADLDDDALALRCAAVATGLRDLGVNLALAPIVDVLDAPNAWLDDRHWGPDAARAERLGRIYVEAFERAGVATTTKTSRGTAA